MTKYARLKAAGCWLTLAAVGISISTMPDAVAHLPGIDRLWIWLYGLSLFSLGFAISAAQAWRS